MDERQRLIAELRAGGLAVPLDRSEVGFLRRPSQPRHPPRLWDPYQPIGQRTHVEPPDWTPELSKWRPTPMATLPLVTVPRDEPGEPLWFGVYGLTIPGSDDLWVPRLFYADDTPDDEREALTKAAESLGLTVVGSRRRFLDDLWRWWYKDRAALAAWDPGVDLGRLAVGWTRAAKGQCRGGLSLILWSKDGQPDPKRPLRFKGGEVEDGHRPRISFRSIDGTRNLISVSGRGEPDREDRWGRQVIVSVHALVL
ncbi:MAG: hypothetical protein FJ313_05740 [Gemmatimonadetes bacterium]|nr:hypothetical protein [Gemmatimonadota bacterium]